MWSHASAEALKLSLRVSIAATLLMALIGIPVAFWLARRRSLLSRIVECLVSLPLVIPPVVTGHLLLVVLSPNRFLGRRLDRLGLRFALDWKGAVTAAAVVAFPIFLVIARTAFQRCDSRLEDAARVLNSSRARVLFTITIPIALPGLLAAAAVAFARAFGEFGATMMLAGNIPGQTRTIPQAIYSELLAGREGSAWSLTSVSIAVGVAAMAASQMLIRRDSRQIGVAPNA